VKPQLQAIEGGKTDHPEKDPLKPHIESRKDGVFWVTPKVDKESGEIINNESWLCSPMEVIGTGRDDKDQYLIISGWHSVQAYRQQRLSRWLILASVKAGAP
jgi:putative DNA primase/helicase